MYENGLGTSYVRPRDRPSSKRGREEDATQVQRVQYAEELRRFEEKNSALFTRMHLS